MSSRQQPASPFTFLAKEEEGLIIIDMEGPINSRYSPMLRDAIKKAYKTKKQIVIIHLGKVGYMDSSGLATLVEGMQLAEKAHGQFILAGTIHEKVMHLLEISRLDGLFPHYPSIEEAKKGVASS